MKDCDQTVETFLTMTVHNTTFILTHVRDSRVFSRGTARHS